MCNQSNATSPPYHSRERSSDQNFSGPLRQYFLKEMSMSKVTQAECNKVARELNVHPSKG